MIGFLLLIPAVLYGVSVILMLAHINRVTWPGPTKRSLWQIASVVPGAYIVYLRYQPWRQSTPSNPVDLTDLRPFLIVNAAITAFSCALLWVVHPLPLVLIQTAAVIVIWIVYWNRRRAQMIRRS
jgi:hypothetical protein